MVSLGCIAIYYIIEHADAIPDNDQEDLVQSMSSTAAIVYTKMILLV
jgi:hypothetical protein